MRRSLGPGVVIALAMSLLLAASVAAGSPFSFTKLQDVCTLGGGDHGFGYVKLKIKVREEGASGANYFRVRTKVQYLDPDGNGWFTLDDLGWQNSTVFPNNSTSYFHVRSNRFDPDGTPDAGAHRMWMKIQVWSNSSGLLASHIITGQKCVTGLG